MDSRSQFIVLEIQGNYGEGGGSIVRLAVALSAITNTPIKITNIRKGREKPGLKEQHLQAIRSVAELCNGKLKGDKLASTEIEFIPGEIKAKKLNVKIGTAGSVGLLLQCLMPVVFFNSTKTEINIQGGGTFGTHSPNSLYLKHILIPTIEKMGFKTDLEIKREGFFPKGGALVRAVIHPIKEIKPLMLNERGKLIQINGEVIVEKTLEKANVASRISLSAKQVLTKTFTVPIEIATKYVPGLSTGAGILVYADYENCRIAWDALGERGKSSETVGREAAIGLLKQTSSDATVDEYLADQLLIYLAFCKEKSIIKFPVLTKHAETNIWLIKHFLKADFNIKNNTLEVQNPVWNG